jgi:sigma-B regulation protein RsbU (phosphoserine phosphatase)
MSLRTKLALLVSGLGMTLVLVMLLLVNQILLSHFRRVANEDVAGARELLAQSFAQSLDRYVIQGRMIADATLLKEALIRDSPELAYTYADSARDLTSIFSVAILDRKGTVLADAGGELARGSKMEQAHESSNVDAGLLTSNGALFAVAVIPVTIDRQVIGRVVVKDPMSAARLALVKELSRSEITLVDRGGRRLISTLPDRIAEQVPRGGTGENGPTAPEVVSISGETYLAAVAPLIGIGGDSLGSIVIARSMADQEQARKHLQQWLFALGAAFTLIAAAGGVAIGFRLSRPMRALTAAAMRLERGEVVDAAIEKTSLASASTSKDEMTILARAFNTMAASVVFRQERLQKEMQLAQRIQVAILPRKLEVTGLELAASMRPASEVGGDYYDVLPVYGGCFIGIGDVAGHGLNAGLVMLMLQSMIAVMVGHDPNAKPSTIITAVNDAIFANVRDRLGKDDHATLTLLRYREDGSVLFAGAHEDVLVCRAMDGRTEIIGTTGTWVGARRAIGGITEDESLELHHGDVMVLYTDGATEAMNLSGEMFGTERLARELERVRDQPVDAIEKHLMSAVVSWARELVDDVSLVVARYVR